MEQVDGEARLRNLLREYQPPDEPPAVDNEKQEAEARAEAARTALAVTVFAASVTPSSVEGSFILRLTSAKAPSIPGDVEVKVWPVTLQESAGRSPDRGPTFSVAFDPITFEAITTFFAFAVRAKFGQHTAVKRFAVNVPVEGLPEDRKERLLQYLLNSRGEIIRFLLFLLADEDTDALSALAGMVGKTNKDSPDGAPWVSPEFSLLEPLLRTLHRHPDKLDRVAKLVADLRKTPNGMDLLPPGFVAAWDPIWKARQELQS
jgi:hypothetical protein